HLFLDLPAFKERLTEWIASHENWRQNVRAFSRKFVEELRPRAITRDLDWGVPIPVPGYDGLPDKKIYVWFDAVIGYLSASVEWAASRGTPDAWRDWWQNPDAHHYYVMGKDNITFHTVMWPSILLGYGEGGELRAGRREEADERLLAAVEGGFEPVGEKIEVARFKAALGEVMALATQVNQYVSEQAPWALVKDDRDRAATVLYVALRCIDNLKTLFT